MLRRVVFGSLVWALTKRKVTGRRRLTEDRPQVHGAHLTGGKLPTLPSAWRGGRASDYIIAIEQYFY